MAPDSAYPIATRIDGLVPTAVNAISAEIRALREQGRSIASLMRGEPDFPTPAYILEAGVAAIRAGRTSYADNRGELALREAVAAKLQRENGIEYDPGSEILITDGATLGIHAALMTILNPGDEILVPEPIYDAYQSPIRLAGGCVRSVPARRGASGRFEIEFDSLEAACSRATRGILLNNPWNPVGTVLRRDELERLGRLAIERNLVLISDEIYEAITYEPHAHTSPASLDAALRDRTIVVNSFSKTYAMTGWRLGYCAAPKRFLQAMFLVLQQSSRGPATFVQDAGIAALAGPQDCVASMRAEYSRRRAAVSDALGDMSNVRVLEPEGGFFTMLDISGTGRSSNEARRHLLESCGVAVVHGSAYGQAGEGTLRVAFASGGTALANGLELLRQGLQTL